MNNLYLYVAVAMFGIFGLITLEFVLECVKVILSYM